MRNFCENLIDISGSLGVAAEEDEIIDDDGVEDLDAEGDAEISDEDEDGKVESEDELGQEPDGPQSTDADTVSDLHFVNLWTLNSRRQLY